MKCKPTEYYDIDVIDKHEGLIVGSVKFDGDETDE